MSPDTLKPTRNGGPPAPAHLRDLAKQGALEMKRIGVTGVHRGRRFGTLQREFIDKLRSTRRHEVFREMRLNDATIHGVLGLIRLFSRAVDWHVEPADTDSREAVEAAEFVDGALGDMEKPWKVHVEEFLTCLPHGFHVAEKLFKRREGRHPDDPTRHSAFDDGRIGWRRFAPRLQDSIEEWRFDEAGEITAAVQTDPESFDEFTIPRPKMLLFRASHDDPHPAHGALLRGVFVSWYRKKNMEEIEGIGAERDLAGYPVMKVPLEWFLSDASPDQQAALAEMEDIVRNIRRDENEGAVLPNRIDPESNEPLIDLKLLSTGGQRQFDTNKIITRYDQRVGASLFPGGDFIFLGQDNVGSFALATVKLRMFARSLDGVHDHIADEVNRHAIPQLLRLNGMGDRPAPRLRHEPIQEHDLAELGLYVKRLAESGFLSADGATEERLREAGMLPESDEGTEVDAG